MATDCLDCDGEMVYEKLEDDDTGIYQTQEYAGYYVCENCGETEPPI